MTVRIVAAALKRGDLIFSAPPPARHHTLLHAVDRLFGDKHEIFLPAEQGFLASNGRFYQRVRAKEIAGDAGQIGSTASDELFSEDLW